MTLKLRQPIEWPTLILIPCTYILWVLIMISLSDIGIFSVICLAPLITLHSSLLHEILHGHPFKDERINHVLAYLPLGLFIPFLRFKTLHLAHHADTNLTDPFDDPESYYWDEASFEALPKWFQRLLYINNTLIGRIFIGPSIAIIRFYQTEWAALKAGNIAISIAWIHHMIGLFLLMLISWILIGDTLLSPIMIATYFISAYLGFSILMIRTFLEHQASDRARNRSVIIENSKILSFLFLNNNLHAVHHRHPQIAWYRLPQLYKAKRAKYLNLNAYYFYNSYFEIFKEYAFRAKEPVIHPNSAEKD